MRRLSLVLLLIALLIPTGAIRVSAQTAGPIYVVQAGDTLTAIAIKFGTTVDELISANGIADPSSIVPGQEIVIPGFESISGRLTTRAIEFGETMGSLSLRYGVPQPDLIRLNRVIRPDRLYVGQEVILPENPEDGAGLSSARRWLLKPGESVLEAAVRAGVSPWSLDRNDTAVRTWRTPGELLAAPGGEEPPIGLPEPVLAVQVEPSPATQGRTMVVRILLAAPAWAEGRFDSWALGFFSDDAQNLVGMQGVHAMLEPGFYDLQIDLYASEGGARTYQFSQPIRVRSGGYGFDPILSVPPETVDPANTEPEDALFDSVVNVRSPDKLWDGGFSYPSTYFTDAFPSVFGTRRNYNNLGYRFYHTGLDFYGGTGVEIHAPARGRVAFADSLTVRGNTTIIDHGWGVFTVYMHQSEILVQAGQLLEAGETIGLVGGTGRVTGPHLHWEVRVGGVPVDPLEWVERAFP